MARPAYKARHVPDSTLIRYTSDMKEYRPPDPRPTLQERKRRGNFSLKEGARWSAITVLSFFALYTFVFGTPKSERKEREPVVTLPKPFPMPADSFKKEPALDWKAQAKKDLAQAISYFGNPELGERQKFADKKTNPEALCRLSGQWLQRSYADFQTLWKFIHENRELWPAGSSIQTMVQKLENPSLLMRMTLRGRSGYERGANAMKLGKDATDPTSGCGPFIISMIGQHRDAVQVGAPNWARDFALELQRALDTQRAQGSVSVQGAYEAFIRSEKAIQELGRQ